ncbi:MYND-type domain-containing protein [Citrus sinensis]|uniref:MYND-type domain-containing protein n=1 Tax=Citrus sinensis TaxID=2711 RepID=A0ACB8MLF0_CITSI|nr:MYND-type domain-containing protein [Citrus sinensis]
MESGANGDSIEKLQGLQITPLDDDDEEEREMVAYEYEDDDEDDGEDEEEQEPVTLGFLEKPKNRWSLLRHLFPSKAGGPPAWLDPINLPTGRSCLCDMCGEPLQFVLQVYAPIIEKESTFHRTLFLFMCPSMACLRRDQHEQWKRPPEKASRSYRALILITQVSPQNAMELTNLLDLEVVSRLNLVAYSALRVGQIYYLAMFLSVIGVVPGKEIKSAVAVGELIIANRNTRSPTGDQVIKLNVKSSTFLLHHLILTLQMLEPLQVKDIDASKLIVHQEYLAEILSHIFASNSLWPEYEMINEDESEYDTEMSEVNGQTNALVSKTGVDDTMKSLLDSFEGDSDRRSWATFQEHVAKAPEQVLRYCRSAGAKALWPTSSGQLSKADIPKCSYCGGPRCFEFQILPQLLFYFGVSNDVDSLDWATMVVYTCESSCEANATQHLRNLSHGSKAKRLKT